MDVNSHSTDIHATISIPVSRGEETRRLLRESGLLDLARRIERKDDRLIIPLLRPFSVNDADLIDTLERKGIEYDLSQIALPPARRPRTRGSYLPFLPDIDPDLKAFLPTSFDVIGSICIIKLHEMVFELRHHIAHAIMTAHPSMTGVFLDTGIRGEYRVRGLMHLAGESSTVTIHREYGIQLEVDLAKVYFSPRLAGERNRIALEVEAASRSSPAENVLDMFCGVGPYALSIGKRCDSCTVHAVDINPHAIEYLRYNCSRNRIPNIIPHHGDATEIVPGIAATQRFNRIIMNLPHTGIKFLGTALKAMDRGMIHLYSIGPSDDVMINEQYIRGTVVDHGKRTAHITSTALKGYSPSETVYVHDIEIGD